jgi:hypothetical protein
MDLFLFFIRRMAVGFKERHKKTPARSPGWKSLVAIDFAETVVTL